MSLLEKVVSEIAVDNVAAAAVLRRHKIDFCCNGHLRLVEAAQKASIDPARLLAELEAVTAGAAAAPRAPDALIAHILERYHAVHRRELAELCRLARRVEAVHHDKPGCPLGLADFLVGMLGELEAHMYKEEQVLFPTLLSGGGGCAPFAIVRMRAEHEDHTAHLRELAERTNGFTPPPGACNSWRALYAGCAKLDADLREHIRLENEVLFPAFEAV